MKDKYYYVISSHSEERIESLKEFESSIFHTVYESLYRVVSGIIAEKNKKHGDIIALLGERGSGKTSVMSSFAKSLGEKDNSLLQKAEGQQVQFSVMESMDASMLDSEEDVFDILLARMLKNIEELIDDNRYREGRSEEKYKRILAKFDHIFENHQMIKSGKKEETFQTHSALSALHHFADSLGLISEFERLVEDYLEIMLGSPWGCPRGKIENYLVIMIDDLDINVKYGSRSLEQIYRYIAVKNVIVVTAVKYEQMEYLVEKHTHELFPKINKEVDEMKLEYIEKASIENLEKILPIQRRIHMPDLSSNFINQQKSWFIKEEDEDGHIIREGNMKEMVLQKIAAKTGMCFDMCGKKKHFLEPASLRELNGYYTFLDRQLKDNGEQDTEIILHNSDQFISDFINRIVYQEVTARDRKEILSLCKLNYRGFNMRLMSLLKGNQRFTLSKQKSYKYKQSYGEILRRLYDNSRTEENDKKFAYAIMVIYTYLIQRELLKGSKDDSGFRELLDGSWAGRWSEHILPPILLSADQEKSLDEKPALWGCMEQIDPGTNDMRIKWNNCEKLEPEEWIKKNQGKLTELEWLFFFFERFYFRYGEGENLILNLEFEEGSASWRVMNYQCDFNVLAFIKNSYYFEEYFQQLYGAVAKAFVKSFDLANSETDIEGWKKQFLDHSVLYKKYKNWTKGTKKMAVPVQYTDMYYHMLHRLQQWMREMNFGIISPEKALQIVALLYQQLKLLLEEEGARYGSGIETEFANNFNECPFVSYIFDKGLSKNKGIQESFGKLVEFCARTSRSSRIAAMTLMDDELTTSSEMMEW